MTKLNQPTNQTSTATRRRWVAPKLTVLGADAARADVGAGNDFALAAS